MPASTSGDSTDPRASTRDDLAYVPLWLRVGAGWSWRLLVVGAAVVGLWTFGSKLGQIVVPVLLAVLIASGMSPMTAWLQRKGAPRWLGALASLLVLVLVVSGLLALVGAQIASQWQQLSTTATTGFSEVLEWLATGPLRISEAQVNDWIRQMVSAVEDSRDQIATWAATAGSGIGSFFAGLVTTLFVAFFFLKDGRRITGAFAKVLPGYALATISPAVSGGWTALTHYVRAAVAVAAIDGVGAGLGALILGSNLWLAIMALTFVCSFVPILGAMIAGTVAVVVVLVTLGPIKAVIMLVVFVAVMGVESHLLQPLLLGRAVEIHPLLVLLGITAGAILAGIAGAFFAIPLIAFVSGCIRSADPDPGPETPGRRLPNLHDLQLPTRGRRPDDVQGP
ncbi:AI-2E family transporter [Brooklawnia cerclae]|uniref:PurR-regulated permease PerM n=1 Tax=Brooklawnia cerclae TaxID=349934 RepID=A0ABX0SH82_9ACTN|nr:AI-2E family transporter [Brooklawnia cerclae]NIH57754.1 putative PurR-regulated permease PerM [Brooklawnia cerclae]